MKRLALCFNSSYLGGAERSVVYQAKKLNDAKVTCFIPFIENHTEAKGLVEFVESELPDGRLLLLG